MKKKLKLTLNRNIVLGPYAQRLLRMANRDRGVEAREVEKASYPVKEEGAEDDPAPEFTR